MKSAAARRTDPAQAALQLTLPLFATPPAATPAQQPAPRGPSIVLDGQLIPYWLRRSRRRTIGFMIDDRGLGVTIPYWVTRAQTDEALREKSAWILRQLANWREHVQRRERLATRWEPGGSVRVLGSERVLALDPRARGVVLDDTRLVVGLPPGAPPEQVRKRVQNWLREQARAHFAARIPVFSARLGRAPRRWALSSARTLWGSCTREGSIRLNWRLIHFRAEVIDYVIAHEVAHLRQLDHGERFWATVRELFPDYARVRAELRAAPDNEASE